MSEQIPSVIILEPSAVFRAGLRQILKNSRKCLIAGEYSSAEEALANIKRLRPDIAIIGNALPGMNGIQACRRISSRNARCGIIMFNDDPRLIEKGLAAGAAFYLSRDSSPDDILTAVKLVSKWQSGGEVPTKDNHQPERVDNKKMKSLSFPVQAEKYLPINNEADRVPVNEKCYDSISKIVLVIRAEKTAPHFTGFISRMKQSVAATISEMVELSREIHLHLFIGPDSSLDNVLNQLHLMSEVRKVVRITRGRTRSIPDFHQMNCNETQQFMVTLNEPARVSPSLSFNFQSQPVPVNQNVFTEIVS